MDSNPVTGVSTTNDPCPFVLQEAVDRAELDRCRAAAREELIIGMWNTASGRPVGWRSANTSSISQLLREFFRFYATFVAEQSALCPLMGKVLPRHQLKDPLAGRELARPAAWTAYCEELTRTMKDDTALVVQDPTRLTFNVARSYRLLELNLFRDCCKQAAEMPLDRLFEEEVMPIVARNTAEDAEAAGALMRTKAAATVSVKAEAAAADSAATVKSDAAAAKKTETAAAEVAISESRAVIGTDKRTLESTGNQIEQPAAKRTKHSSGGDDGQSREISSSVAGVSSQSAAELPSGGETWRPAEDARRTEQTMDTGGGSDVGNANSGMPYTCSICDETMESTALMNEHLLGDKHQLKARGAAFTCTERESPYLYMTVTTELQEVSYGDIFKALKKNGHVADFRFTGNPKPQLGTQIYVKYRKRGVWQNLLRMSKNGHLVVGSTALRLELSETKYLSREPPVQQAVKEENEEEEEEAPRAGDPTNHTLLLTRLIQKLSDGSEDDALCWLTDQLVLTPAEHQQRIDYCNELQHALRYRFRGCIVWGSGSSFSDLGFRGCDQDLYVSIDPNIKNSGLPPDADQASKVDVVAKWLDRQPHVCTQVVPIPQAPVPSIRFRAPPLGDIQCDLNFKDKIPWYNSRLIGMLMKTDPRVRPLTVAVRYWARRRNLAGGEAHPLKMASYCLTLLVVTFLQQLQPPVLPTVDACQAAAAKERMIGPWNTAFDRPARRRSENTSSISQLLREFFRFYATFVAEQSALCPLMGKVLPRHQLKDPLAGRELARPAAWAAYCDKLAGAMEDNTALVVQDPIELNVNVAHNFVQLGLNRFRHCCKQAAEMPLDRLFEEEKMPMANKSEVEQAEAAGAAVRTLAAAAAKAEAAAAEEEEVSAEEEEYVSSEEEEEALDVVCESRAFAGTDKRTLESTGYQKEESVAKRTKHSDGGDGGQSREISSSAAGGSGDGASSQPAPELISGELRPSETRPSEASSSKTPPSKTTAAVASDPALLRRVLSDFDRPPSRLIVLPLEGPDGRRWSPSSWRCTESAEACGRFLGELFNEVLRFECITMLFDDLDLPLNVVRGYQCKVLLPTWQFRKLIVSDLARRRWKLDLAFEAEVTERALRRFRYPLVPTTLATFSCYLVLLEDEEQLKVCLYEGETTSAGKNCFSFLESYLPDVTSRCMVHYADCDAGRGDR